MYQIIAIIVVLILKMEFYLIKTYPLKHTHLKGGNKIKIKQNMRSKFGRFKQSK